MPPTILAGALPGGVNIFSSPPPNPGINDPCMPKPPSFPPIPIRRRNPTPNNTPTGSNKPNPNPALKSTHRRTKYYKPVTDDVIQADGDRAVVISDSGVSYLLPGAPFEFQFSYSETPKVKPIAFREPAFLPFGPPTMSRPWTGKAPLKSKKEKELKRQKRVRLVPSSQSEEKEESEKKMVMETSRQITGNYRMHRRSREEILGKPLSKSEIRALVKPCLSRNRQVNLGRDGLIHNMLELIHSHWRRHEICKVRCRGVPTLDMDNVCHHLEEKTRGKIIHRVGGVIYLYRGRNYDPLNRPRYPVMLWKPAAPVYPKLIQEAPVGLTKVEADRLRNDGKKLLPICKLAKNGIYVDLVQNVRDAFEGSSLVKINCKGLEPSDYKKIGAKLKDLVPCVLMSFDDEQILIWRGNDWKSTTPSPNLISNRKISGTGNAGKLRVLWKSAIDAKKALLLDDESVAVSPDLLLEKVEQFESVSQATAHSYTARILVEKKENNFSSEDDEFLLVEEEKTKIPFGSLGVDQITRQ